MAKKVIKLVLVFRVLYFIEKLCGRLIDNLTSVTEDVDTAPDTHLWVGINIHYTDNPEDGATVDKLKRKISEVSFVGTDEQMREWKRRLPGQVYFLRNVSDLRKSIKRMSSAPSV